MGKKQNNYKQINYKQNYKFTDSLILNTETYIDFLERFKKVALSVFEWVNLPDSMNSMYLERCLYFYGQASLLKDKNYGFINTKCNSNGTINIYGLPTSLKCYSYEYNTSRKLYSGLIEGLNNEEKENLQYKSCVLVQNDWERVPTSQTMELFAWRLYEAQRSADINIHGQKFPLLIITDEKQRLTLENMYNEYNGNRFVIFRR